jgi:hypothetical protein
MLHEVANLLRHSRPRHPSRLVKAEGHRLLLSVVLHASRKVFRNPVLLGGLVLLGLASLAVGAWLTVVLISLASPALEFVQEQGLKGALEALQSFATSLWNGRRG